MQYIYLRHSKHLPETFKTPTLKPEAFKTFPYGIKTLEAFKTFPRDIQTPTWDIHNTYLKHSNYLHETI